MKPVFCIIVGTRPEIIKLAPVLRELMRRHLDHFVIHTNQHYSREMDAVFFEELALEPPQYNLGVGSGSHGEQTGKMIMAIEKILMQRRPRHLIVQGDTNSVVAGALAAAKELSIQISHVEAGLRSYDRSMPEEINRIIADHVSDFLFVPTKTEQGIALREGIPEEKVFIIGNTIVDAIQQNLPLAEKSVKVLETLQVTPEHYFLLTLHRPSNVDTPETLQGIVDTIAALNRQHGTVTVFPCHPRTQERITSFGIAVDPSVHVVKPLGYLAMLYLMRHARLILTDSGGIQEEACVMQRRCVTLRFNTERPATLEVGGNILAGNTPEGIQKAVTTILERTVTWSNPFGDGATAKKIVDILLSRTA